MVVIHGKASWSDLSGSLPHRHLEMRVKEHKDAWGKGYTRKSDIAQHVWVWKKCINYEGTNVMDRTTRHTQLMVKEGFCIQIPVNSRINRDEGSWLLYRYR